MRRGKEGKRATEDFGVLIYIDSRISSIQYVPCKYTTCTYLDFLGLLACQFSLCRWILLSTEEKYKKSSGQLDLTTAKIWIRILEMA